MTKNSTYKMKWSESGFRPPLCTYRLNWARRTSWGWWDDWDNTVLQTQDSKFEPWRPEAEHATSRSQRLPTILTFTRGWGRNSFCFSQTAKTGNRTPNSGVKSSGANRYPRAPALCLDKCHSQRQMSQLCLDKCHSQRQMSQHYHDQFDDYQRQMPQTSNKCQSSYRLDRLSHPFSGRA